MGLIDDAVDALRFKDTIFYKKNSDLQAKYDALKKLNCEFPNNEKILNELFLVKNGLKGENEISYQLNKSHIGMYVLRDVKLKYEDLTAQIDYVIITSAFVYYIECKNLLGNITVNEKGDFIREFTFNGKKIIKGMYSPLRQVEAQREVVRKIWESKSSKLGKLLASKDFNYYRKVLVVAANHDTILDTSKAPNDIKYKVLRADSLIRQIEYYYNHRKKDTYLYSRKEMKERAKSYFNLCSTDVIDYYEYYKSKYCLNNTNNKIVNDNLKERLINLRKIRSSEMHIPPYYVFNNDELDKLVQIRPKSLDELKKANLLTPIKIKTHGNKIIEEINK